MNRFDIKQSAAKQEIIYIEIWYRHQQRKKNETKKNTHTIKEEEEKNCVKKAKLTRYDSIIPQKKSYDDAA